MLVLHTHWQPALKPGDKEGVIFWCETSAAEQSKRDKGHKKVQAHPFAARGKEVKDLVVKLIGRQIERKYRQITLWLPTDEFGPQPSPYLVHDWEVEANGTLLSDDGPLTLLQWKIRGVWVTPIEGFDILMALSNPDIVPPTVGVSDECRYWQVASRLVLEGVTQHKIRPALMEVQAGKCYEARWLPVLDGPKDGPRLAQLVQAMPAICRADTARPAETLPPGAILDTFLNIMTDALARRWGTAPQLERSQQEAGHHWLRALFAKTPVIGGAAAAIQHTYSSYRAWLRNLFVAGGKTYRVALRLEAPIQQKGKKASPLWTLHFFLQARDDPSLLVPAKQVWKTRGSALTLLDRYFEQPQEKLLAGLGYAARFFEPIRRGLQTAKPEKVTLTPQEAYTFMRESAPLLEQSGFGLLVPPWWNKPGTRLGVRLKMSSKLSTSPANISSGTLNMDNLVRYRWEISLGDTTLTREEFDALVNLKSPLVQVRGQWVQLDSEQIEAAINFWEKQTDLEDEISLLQALQLGLDAADDVAGLPVDGVELDDELSEWVDQINGDQKLDLLPPPKSLNATLRPYQEYGYSWLDFMHRWGMGAILADDMGLGKCNSKDILILVNGNLQTAEAIWESFAGTTQFDGEGFWATPTEPLLVNAIDEGNDALPSGIAASEATGQMCLTPIRQLYRQRVRESLRQIELEDGSQITITQPHKLLTNRGWTNDLQVGDYVCVPAKIVWHGEPADPDLVKFVAWQIAEGHELSDEARLNIFQKNTPLLEGLLQTLQRISQRYNIKINKPAIRQYQERVPKLEVNSKAYREFLEGKGYQWGNLSAEKVIPPFIMQADLDSVRLFLRHYFDAEGSVIKSMRSIEISSASSLLMQQLSVLLRRFGIWLRICAKQKRATNGSGIYRTYYIGTMGGNAARLFLQEIGFGYADKQRKLEAICARKCNTNVEGIPASEIVAEAVATTKLPVSHFGIKSVYINGSQQFSQASLQRVVTHIERILSGEAEQEYRKLKPSKWTARTLAAYQNLDRQELAAIRQQLQHLLEQEVFYCKIKAIEEIAYDGWVYDFEVPKHHNFVANNILCHNTIQTLTMLSRDKEEGISAGPVLLICPTSVVTNWQKECQRFTPNLTTMVHQGPKRLRGQKFIKQAQEVDLVLTSYALVRRDEKTFSQLNWYGVVLDEAQNIKNAQTKQAKVIRALPAGFRLALTGTPVENRLSELWSIMHFLNPGYLGGQKQFRQTFGLPIERDHDQEAIERLRRLTQPFILRRVKTDPTVIQDLPEKQEMKVYCNLTKEQATLYEAVVRDAMAEVEESEGIQRKGLIFSLLMKLKQICNHPAQFLQQIESYEVSGEDKRSAKLARLTQMLEELLAEGDRALIFTQFAQMGHLLKRYIQAQLGVSTLFLHGGVPGHKREGLVKRFQEAEDGPPIFILSIKAGGTGLNLTRANHVFHFDRWWNPAVEDQATDRAFRIGQKQNVLVHKFVCLGTIEEKVDEMIEQKKTLAESIIGSGENWLTEMSTNDLRELVALRREMMG